MKLISQLALAAALLLVGGAAQAEKLKVGFIYTTLPVVHFPSVLKIKTLDGIAPRPELKLESGTQEVEAEVTFRYGENLVRAARPGQRFFSLKGRRLIALPPEEIHRAIEHGLFIVCYRPCHNAHVEGVCGVILFYRTVVP